MSDSPASPSPADLAGRLRQLWQDGQRPDVASLLCQVGSPSVEQVVALLEEGTVAARETGDTMALVRLLTQRGLFSNDAGVLAETGLLLEGVADKRPYGDALYRLALVHLAANGESIITRFVTDGTTRN